MGMLRRATISGVFAGAGFPGVAIGDSLHPRLLQITPSGGMGLRRHGDRGLDFGGSEAAGEWKGSTVEGGRGLVEFVAGGFHGAEGAGEGAGLEVSSSSGIPPAFTLAIPADGLEAECQVVSRVDRRIEVEFR